MDNKAFITKKYVDDNLNIKVNESLSGSESALTELGLNGTKYRIQPKETTLWENTSPTAEFSAKEFALNKDDSGNTYNVDNFDYVVVYLYSFSGNTTNTYCKVFKINKAQTNLIYNDYAYVFGFNSDRVKVHFRYFHLLTTTFKCDACTLGSMVNGGTVSIETYNGNLRPAKIVGINL